MSATRVVGRRSALLSLLRDAHRAVEAARPEARRIVAAHDGHCLSDESIVRLDDEGWTVLGPSEEHRALLGLGPQYLAVTSRDHADLDRVAVPLAAHRARLDGRDDVAAALLHPAAVEHRDAADAAAPMIAVALAACVRAGLLDWDSDETVYEAATRFALDAAWTQYRAAATPRPGTVFSTALSDCSIVGAADDFARGWRDQREEILRGLDAEGITFGGPALDLRAAAGRAGVVGSTWSAYVARGEAPAADLDSRWRAATVDAWLILRPRARPRW